MRPAAPPRLPPAVPDPCFSILAGDERAGSISGSDRFTLLPGQRSGSVSLGRAVLPELRHPGPAEVLFCLPQIMALAEQTDVSDRRPASECHFEIAVELDSVRR